MVRQKRVGRRKLTNRSACEALPSGGALAIGEALTNHLKKKGVYGGKKGALSGRHWNSPPRPAKKGK